tara:strand:- start:81280 stop:81744 length:465 start_codon:yes stop_codon:yes gene_type:complete
LKDLSQEDLGNLVDLNYNHIGRYERGSNYQAAVYSENCEAISPFSRPSAHKLRAMADALGVTTDYPLGGSEDNSLKADIDDVHGGPPHKDVAVSRRPWMVEREQVSRAPWMPNKDVPMSTKTGCREPTGAERRTRSYWICFARSRSYRRTRSGP